MRADFAEYCFRTFRVAYECAVDDLIRAHPDFDLRHLTWERLPPEQNEHLAIVLSYRDEPVLLFEQWTSQITYQWKPHGRRH